jgi:hypothetical protein
MRRRLAALGLLVLLALTSGCFGIFGPGEPDPDALSANATYDWNTSTDATIDIRANNYTSVLDVANKSTGDAPDAEGGPTIELYQRDALGTEQPLSLTALQYRFPNGSRVVYESGEPTLVGPNGTAEPTDALSVSRTRRRTVVSLPDTEGQLAYTTNKVGKEIATPTFVEGSYRVVIPEDTAVAVPLIARVRPGGYTTERVDERVNIVWDPVRGQSLIVRYYLDRDLLILGALVALLGLAGLAGAVYYLLQIRELVERREEVGLDVDVPDDDRDGPPPGMR